MLPKYRKVEDTHWQYRKTGRSYRPPQEWVWNEAPAIISPELFEKAQLQLQRNAAAARKLYQASSRRYRLRTLVKCGECGLGCACICQGGKNPQVHYLYYEGKGRQPLTCGRVTKCPAHLVRADRLDAVVWASLCQLLRTPSVIPTLHQSWAQAKQQNLTALTAQQTQVLQRRQRVERQSHRLLDAYQAEAIPLSELQVRRHKLTNEVQHLDLELQQLTQTQQQAIQWHQIIDHAERFRQLLGENLERLSFAERQITYQASVVKRQTGTHHGGGVAPARRQVKRRPR